MTLTTKMTTLGLIAALAGASLAPAMANDQSDKNNARNLAIGGGAVALYGLLNHNNVATLLGAAGAALAGSQYEKDRKDQSQDNSRYYYRGGYNGYNNGFDRNGYDNSGYNRDGFNRDGRDRDGHDRNYRNSNDNQYRDNRGNDNWNQGNHNGWNQGNQNQNNWHQDGSIWNNGGSNRH